MRESCGRKPASQISRERNRVTLVTDEFEQREIWNVSSIKMGRDGHRGIDGRLDGRVGGEPADPRRVREAVLGQVELRSHQTGMQLQEQRSAGLRGHDQGRSLHRRSQGGEGRVLLLLQAAEQELALAAGGVAAREAPAAPRRRANAGHCGGRGSTELRTGWWGDPAGLAAGVVLRREEPACGSLSPRAYPSATETWPSG